MAPNGVNVEPRCTQGFPAASRKAGNLRTSPRRTLGNLIPSRPGTLPAPPGSLLAPCRHPPRSFPAPPGSLPELLALSLQPPRAPGTLPAPSRHHPGTQLR